MSEATRVEWSLPRERIVDEAFLKERGHELHGATRLRVGPASFYSKACLSETLVPTLRQVSFSFFEVGATAGGRPKPRAETNDALSVFGELRNLEDLDLSWSYCIDDSGIDSLAKLGNLQRLSLESDITDHGLSCLAALHRLRAVDFSCSSNITGSGFSAWPEMPYLRAVVLSECSQVSDAALQLVPRLPELDYLVLSGCRNLSLDGLSELKASSNLESIELFGVKVDLPTLKALRKNNPNATLNCNMDHFPENDRPEVESICRV